MESVDSWSRPRRDGGLRPGAGRYDRAEGRPNGDPNQVICRTETEIGSRLSRRRVCRTRSEWATLEQQTRQTVDRTQTYRPTCENGRC